MNEPKRMTLADLANSTKPQSKILTVEEKVAQKRAELESKHKDKVLSAIKEITDTGKTFIGAEEVARIENKSRKEILNRDLSGATTVNGALELTEDVAKVEDETNNEIYGKFKITQDVLIERGYTEESILEYLKAVNQAKSDHLANNKNATPFDKIDLSGLYDILRFRDDYNLSVDEDFEESPILTGVEYENEYDDSVKVCEQCREIMNVITIPSEDGSDGAIIYECESCGAIVDSLSDGSNIPSDGIPSTQFGYEMEEDDNSTDDSGNVIPELQSPSFNHIEEIPESSREYNQIPTNEEMMNLSISNTLRHTPKELRNLTPLERMKLMNSQLGAKITCYLPISNYTITVHENKSATYLPQMYNILGKYMENGMLDREILRNIFESSEFHVKGNVTFDKFMNHTDASEVDLIFSLFALANAPRDKNTGRVLQKIFSVKCDSCGYHHELFTDEKNPILSIRTYDEFKNSYPASHVANRMLDSYIYNQDISIEESNTRVSFGDVVKISNESENFVTTVGIKRPSIAAALTRTTHAVSHVITNMRKRQKIETSDLKLMSSMTIEEQHNFMQTGKYASTYNAEYATLSNIIIVAQFVESINIEVKDSFLKEQKKMAEYSRMSLDDIRKLFNVSIKFNSVSSKELLDTLSQLSDDIIVDIVKKTTEIMSVDSDLVFNIKLTADQIKDYLKLKKLWGNLTTEEVKSKSEDMGISYEELEESRTKLLNGLCPHCNGDSYIVEGSSLLSFLILQKMSNL